MTQVNTPLQCVTHAWSRAEGPGGAKRRRGGAEMEEIVSVGGWTVGPDVAPAFGVFAEKRRHLWG